MKKIIYVLSVLLLLFVAACAKTAVQPQTNEQKALDENTVAKGGATVAKGCDWTADDQSSLESKYAPGATMLISKGYGTASKGGCMAFGVLAANIESDTQSVFTQIAFSRAYDGNSNPIEVADASLTDWVADNNDPREAVVASGKYTIFPYFIKVGQMKPGTDPVSGTYEFEVTTWVKLGGVNKEIGKMPVSIKVTG